MLVLLWREILCVPRLFAICTSLKRQSRKKADSAPALKVYRKEGQPWRKGSERNSDQADIV